MTATPEKLLNKLDSWVTSLLKPGTLLPWCLLFCWVYLTAQYEWLSAMFGAPILAAIFTLLLSLFVLLIGLLLMVLGTLWFLAEQPLSPESPETKSRLP
ncbi:hypothetical protein CWC22_022675 [Pseudoalteromonas rubra]|uniref:Uncharacterized protein n=1 Tax=Pseudoalteromonas rubra TaxID=43658 RepID=A0A5S3UW53_9GAMM|nr:hypothetical protein [Pseudoalteromonas rubra]QPB85809.1 hypothetical protein CWC22_022675 [Pseudoalteromonas rubra]